MSTLAILKAEISDDLARSDIPNQIAKAITDAIVDYQGEPFYFNWDRTLAFVTVANQWIYTSADISRIQSIDSAQVLDGGHSLTLRPRTQSEIEMDVEQGTSTERGSPRAYSFTNSKFYLDPIPSGIYTIRIVGTITVAPPANDAEVNNPWMVDAYSLIRARAKILLGLHVLDDQGLVQRMTLAEQNAATLLYIRTNRRAATNTVTPVPF